MAGRAQNLKDQVGQLWRGAVAQAEGVREQLRSQSKGAASRLRGEIDRLRNERELLLSRLGEQTLSWVNANRKAVPSPLKPTVEKLNRVIERLVKHQAQPMATKVPTNMVVKEEAPKYAEHVVMKHTVVKRAAKKKSAAPLATAKKKSAVKTIAKVSKQPVSRKVLRDQEPA